MSVAAHNVTVEDEQKAGFLGFAMLTAFCSITLVSQVIVCCIWGALSLLGFDGFEED